MLRPAARGSLGRLGYADRGLHKEGPGHGGRTPCIDWLTVQEAASYLKVTRNTVYRYCDLGILPFYELTSGRGRRFKHEDLDSLLKPGQSAHEREADRP